MSLLNNDNSVYQEAENLEKEFASALSKQTVIEGNITTKDSMVFLAAIKGDITSSNALALNGGIVEGSLMTETLKATGGKVRGNVTVKDDIEIDTSSVFIGDLKAHDIKCDGRVKGDLFADGSVSLGSNTVIFGNIKAAEINIAPGAVIKGNVDVVQNAAAASNAFDFEEEFLNIDDFVQSLS